MKILKEEVQLGQGLVTKIPVGQLPSGNPITISTHVYRAAEPGPTLLLLGGVHGDEINGMEIVRQTIQGQLLKQLVRGSVIAIPVLNVYGLINFSREVPDGKDVNRSFPGSSRGSLASRVAFALHKHILPLIDVGLDFHTGGRSNYNYPQIRYTQDDEQAAELASAFGAPVRIAYKPIAKSLRKIARDRHQAPMLVFEGGENQRYDGLSIQYGLAGIRRILSFYEMLDESFNTQDGLHFNHSSWMRAPRGGLFQWMKSSGSWVKKDEPIGFISDPRATKDSRFIHAKADAFMIGHNNTPVVSQGDALFHLAYNE
ncbi:MAG: succinylglutamate desuccinylase/aspartoacylase family protein [Bacteroidota bacterium]